MGLKFPQGGWHCEGLQLWEAEEKQSHPRSDPEVSKGLSLELRSLRKAGHSHLPLAGSDGQFRQGLSHEGTKLNFFFNLTLQIFQN